MCQKWSISPYDPSKKFQNKERNPQHLPDPKSVTIITNARNKIRTRTRKEFKLHWPWKLFW